MPTYISKFLKIFLIKNFSYLYSLKISLNVLHAQNMTYFFQEDYNNAIRNKSDSYDVYNYRGSAFLSLKEYKKALNNQRKNITIAEQHRAETLNQIKLILS